MANYRLILCPVDFSNPSRHALKTALDLAERLKTGLHVLNVYQLPAAVIPETALEHVGDLEAIIQDKLQKELEAFVSDVGSRGLSVATSLREGVPYVEIVQAAKDLGADLIVIGTHGRTGLSHLLVGSVAERVLRTSEVPVLSVRLR